MAGWQFMVVGAHPLDLGWSGAGTIPPRDMPIRDIIKRTPSRRMRRQGKVELLTGIEGASSRPVRRIVLVDK
jgi:hypothetical protein